MKHSNTKLLKIGSVAFLGDGAHTKVKRFEEGVYYLSAQNLRKGYIDYSNCSFICEEDFQRLFSKSKGSIRDLQKDDILFSIIGTIGNLYKYKKDDRFGISSSVAILRPKRDLILPDYLYWILRSKYFAEIINRKKGGSVQDYTNLPLLRDTEIPVPESISDQKGIVIILNSIEAKIELNNKINSELEALAKTIYDYWFVQFDFPNAKGKPYKTNSGKMIWNEDLKREIPEEWEVKKISEVATVKAGGDKPESYSIEKTEHNNVPIYSNGITNDGLYGYTSKSIINEQSVSISARGTIGFCVLRNKPFVPIIRLISLTPNLKGSAKYFYEALKNFIFENSGSVQQQLPVPQVTGIKILYPNEGILRKFDEITSPMIDRAESIKEETQQLSELRDWLLPMLMNGQVTVGDAEKMVDDNLIMAAEPSGVYKKSKVR